MKKYDEYFDMMVANPALRREGIRDLSWRRTLMFWCAVVITLCGLVLLFTSSHSSGAGAAGLLFAAAMSWISGSKIDSNLRLLRAIQRLDRRSDDKPKV